MLIELDKELNKLYQTYFSMMNKKSYCTRTEQTLLKIETNGENSEKKSYKADSYLEYELFFIIFLYKLTRRNIKNIKLNVSALI